MIKISTSKKKKNRVHYNTIDGIQKNKDSEFSSGYDNELLLSNSFQRISFIKIDSDNNSPGEDNETDNISPDANNISESLNDLEKKNIKNHDSLSPIINNVIMKKWKPRRILSSMDHLPFVSIQDRDANYVSNIDHQIPSNNTKQYNAIIDYQNNYLSNLSQCLCQKFSLHDRWPNILLKLAKKVVNRIKINGYSGKKMNILTHVKVKTITGGSHEDCKYVSGIVFSKNRVHKKMPTYYENPRILLMSCDLHYSNLDKGLVSIDRLIRYEYNYTTYIVNKLVEYQPNIIISDRNIPYNARELLASHGITVLSNMKPKTIKLISKITGSKIISDIDQLEDNVIGIAKSFNISSYSGPWGMKVCTHLESQSNYEYATIILRGAPSKLLRNIKDIFKYIVFSAYNMKLETKLFDNLTSILDDTSIQINDSFNDYFISSSWSVKIPKPVYDDNKLLSPSLRRDSSICELYADVEKIDNNGEFHPVYNRKLSINCSYRSLLKTVLENDLFNDNRKNSVPQSNLDQSEFSKKVKHTLSPNYIIFLHALLSKTGSLCRLYEWIKIDYYSSNDISLYQFLNDFCFTSNYRCKSCRLSILEHDRSILHNQAKLHISTVPFSISNIAPFIISNQTEPTIYSWAVCKEKENVYAYMKTLSQEEMNISFGKILEHYFYSDKVKCKHCNMSHYKDHIHYFYLNDKVVCFEYTPIKIHSIETPPNIIEIDHLNDSYITVLKEELDSIVELFNTITCRISLKLNACLEKKELLDESDIKLALDRYESDMLELKKQLLDEEEDIFNKRSNIFKINSLRQSLYNLISLWNGIIVQYEVRIQKKLESMKPTKTNYSFPLKTIETSNDLTSSPTSDLIIENSNNVEKQGSNFKVNTQLTSSNSYLSKKNESILKTLDEHEKYIFAQHGDYVVVVERRNPASLISFGLMSQLYKKRLNEFPYSPLKNLTPEEKLFGLLSDSSTTINLEWKLTPIWGGSKIFVQCKSYFSQQFTWLRKLLRIDEIKYAQSLQKCIIFDSSGGKSGASFTITSDQRFIVKSVQNIELIPFLQLSHHYFNYISKTIINNVPTTLTKIVGIYSVTFSLKGKSPKKYHLIVQENLFYKARIIKTYDLKGSLSRRYGKQDIEEKNKKVSLDEDLIESMFIEPICIDRDSKSSLSIKVWNDSIFLSSMNIMDYSLLVGIDENDKLIIGIIDYMRTYTWDKQLETWVKKSGILGGNKSNLPTVISPNQYKKRFRSAMWNYFLMIPYIGIHLVSNKNHM